MRILPVSTIVPTRNRAKVLRRMLASMASQSAQPVEMVVIDASATDETVAVCRENIPGLETSVRHFRASETGAATQRNQGMAHATQDAILFLDDDIVFEDECIARLWTGLQSEDNLGGVNAMIANQRYFPPGRASRALFRLLDGRAQKSYAGQCIGPALNLLPEDNDDLPEVVPVEWLNTTCTLYRRKALPDPPFDRYFQGYSLMEDLTLSLTVGRRWKLANARTARIFHDSQPGTHKQNAASIARMELVNRHYVMTRVLGRRGISDYLKLALFQVFGVTSSLTNLTAWSLLPPVLLGKAAAMKDIIFSNGNSNGKKR